MYIKVSQATRIRILQLSLQIEQRIRLCELYKYAWKDVIVTQSVVSTFNARITSAFSRSDTRSILFSSSLSAKATCCTAYTLHVHYAEQQ